MPTLIQPPLKTVSLLDIRFFAGSFEEALDALTMGGLVVFPAGPGLARDLWVDDNYRQALQTADLAFTDSGAMVLLWRLLSGQKLPRHSGLKVLTGILSRPTFCKEGATFWVMPSTEQQAVNLHWLREIAALPISENDCYSAPVYAPGPVEDAELLRILEEKRPRFVVLCLGGGVQERLGYFLRGKLEKTTSILCTGAAIGFLSGIQARIPQWVDSVLLGWLFRCASDPKTFVPRYLRAMSIVKVMFLYWLCGCVPGAIPSQAPITTARPPELPK